MNIFLGAFLASFLSTALIICTQKIHGNFSSDHDFTSPQKFHTKAVPRIGGVGIVLGMFTASLLNYFSPPYQSEGIWVLFCAIPVFGIGFMEDFTKKIGIRTRLIYTAIGALLATLILNAQITRLDISTLDYLLSISLISIIFTVFAITGLANSYNIIDGFNGLSSMVGAITLIGLSYVSFLTEDFTLCILGLTCAASIIGFFVWNYPKGLIFMGDGGAYLTGFWVAIISILLVERHREVSPWFALLINAYPIVETIFTIYRRRVIHKLNPGNPDALHFHSLAFKYISKKQSSNAAKLLVGPFIWIFSMIAIIPAIIFYKSSIATGLIFVSYFTLYTFLYSKVSRFQGHK